MSTISAQLRNFKEPDRDEQSLLFFAVPPGYVKAVGTALNSPEDGHHRMEINAVLTLAAEGAEDSYVRIPQLVTLHVACYYRRNLGRKASSHPALFRICQPRQKVCTVHHPSMHSSESRTFECPCWYLCAQSLIVAWHEDSTFPSILAIFL
jgi:hypothetical protein